MSRLAHVISYLYVSCHNGGNKMGGGFGNILCKACMRLSLDLYLIRKKNVLRPQPCHSQTLVYISVQSPDIY